MGVRANETAERTTIRFFMPSAELAPYFTTFYLTEVAIAPGEVIEDWLHPEWANIRIRQDTNWQAAIGSEPLRTAPGLIATGPTSLSAHFVTGTMRTWGIGILPQGWARFVAGPASAFADRFVDGLDEPAFEHFAPLRQVVFGPQPDAAAEAARIDAYLCALLRQLPASEDEDRIKAAHGLLVDPDVSSVVELAERLDMSSRSLERFSLKVFGFSPKLLLRRQRFLRSLAQFMLDPSLKWIETLDWHYVDQAHFVRDFKRFMGMSPSSYAQADHPVLRAAAKARAAIAGEAMQVLHRP